MHVKLYQLHLVIRNFPFYVVDCFLLRSSHFFALKVSDSDIFHSTTGKKGKKENSDRRETKKEKKNHSNSFFMWKVGESLFVFIYHREKK